MSDTETPPAVNQADLDKLEKLMTRARAGDRRVLPRLRKFLEANRSVWIRYGDLALHAQMAWIQLAAGPDLVMSESLGRTAEELKAQLAVAGSSLIEKLLIERVVACWLQMAWADGCFAQLRNPSSRQTDELQKRQTLAQRRYLAAVRALAEVRRLLMLTPAKPIAVPTQQKVRPTVPAQAGRAGAAPEKKAVSLSIFAPADAAPPGQGSNRIDALMAAANRDS